MLNALTSVSAPDCLAEAMVAEGIQKVFTLSGIPALPLYDACVRRGISLLHTRHEAAAVHMADAWGRLTEQPGAAIVTGGPGFANTISALHMAREAESPVVLMATQCPLAENARGGYQAMDQVGIASRVAKAAWVVEHPGGVGSALRRAYALAGSGRPGPVFLSLPNDVMAGTVRSMTPAPPAQIEHPPPLAAVDVAALLGHLERAERPLILCAPPLDRASTRPRMRALARAIGVPVVPIASAYGIEDPRLGAFAEVARHADLVLLLGKRADWTVGDCGPDTFGSGCRFLQVDAEAEALEAAQQTVGHRLLGAWHGAPLATGEALTHRSVDRSDRQSAWTRRVEEALDYRPAEWRDLGAEGERVHPVAICRALQRQLRPGDIVITDGGEFGFWAQAAIRADWHLVNGASGLIGFGVPFAVAASLARPDARVYVTSGDGGFGFYPMALDTATREGTAFVVLIGNDARWHAEHKIQIREHGVEQAAICTLQQTRYDQLAEVLGAHGEHVRSACALGAAIARGIESGKPACINVVSASVPSPAVLEGYRIHQGLTAGIDLQEGLTDTS